MPPPIPLIATRRAHERQAVRAQLAGLSPVGCLLAAQEARYPQGCPPCERLLFLEDLRQELAALLAQAQQALAQSLPRRAPAADRAVRRAIQTQLQALQQQLATLHDPLTAALEAAWDAAAQQAVPTGSDLLAALATVRWTCAADAPASDETTAVPPPRQTAADHLLDVEEILGATAALLDEIGITLRALRRLTPPLVPRAHLTKVLAAYDEVSQALGTVLDPLDAALDAAHAAREAAEEAAEIVAQWWTVLPAHQQGRDDCEAYWDKEAGGCPMPTRYVLHGRSTDDLLPPGAWSYCPQHAQELATQYRLALPEAAEHPPDEGDADV
jgi:hypothetical protein